jgi:KaiC/GvpD/RAD55 family RecA-like ATPase
MTTYTNGTTTPIQAFETLTVAKLMTHEFPPIEFTIDEFLPSGALALLVGRPKLGKSLFAIDMMASVASGESFIGRGTNQGPAIYVPAEDALRLVRDRLLNRLGDDHSIPLHVLPADGSLEQSIRLDDPESLARLALTLEAIQPRIVVLDPMREFHHLKEDKADDMAGLLRPLRQMAHDLDVAIVLVHHRNKHATDPSLATRGSSAIAGSVDLIMTMEMSNENDDAELDGSQALKVHVEGRYGPRQRLGARLRAGLRWEPADPRLSDDVPVRERIQRYFETTGDTATAEELAAAVSAPKRSVQNVLPDLLKSNALTRHGAGTKVAPYRYGPHQQPLKNDPGRTRDESFAMQRGKTPDSSRPQRVYVEPVGTNPEPEDSPAHVVQALFYAGTLEDMEPVEIDGSMVIPNQFAKRAFDDARQSGAVGRAGRNRCQKLLSAIKPMIGAA